MTILILLVSALLASIVSRVIVRCEHECQPWYRPGIAVCLFALFALIFLTLRIDTYVS